MAASNKELQDLMFPNDDLEKVRKAAPNHINSLFGPNLENFISTPNKSSST